eukprot:TRINITY_DN32635_c0_g1_i1.p1 TRINITY_DN32635_c0_g1~~TRINITY_DN32635_c0_g1_i1.p1  ORF type:complete len:377 (+),score=60.16 TRINITY_DN32635_c0_g1_i1:41-1171(+)
MPLSLTDSLDTESQATDDEENSLAGSVQSPLPGVRSGLLATGVRVTLLTVTICFLAYRAIGLTPAKTDAQVVQDFQQESLSLVQQRGVEDAHIWAPALPVVAELAPLAPALIPLPASETGEWFATLLMQGNTYLPALKALASSLKATNTKRGLVVMLTEPPTIEMSNLVRCMNLTLVVVPLMSNLDATKPTWTGVYSKLSVFRLAAKRVVFLDADTVVLKNIDDLFSVPLDYRFNAAVDMGYKTSFNSGVLVLEPSSKFYEDLAEFAAENPKIPEPWFDGGDQGMLNYYFRDKWSVANSLPVKYNTMKYFEGSMLSNASVLHVCGARKPWSLLPGDETKDYFNLWPKSYETWQAAWRHYQAQYGEVCQESKLSAFK